MIPRFIRRAVLRPVILDLELHKTQTRFKATAQRGWDGIPADLVGRLEGVGSALDVVREHYER